MDLNLIATFIRVVEKGSFAAAAKSLNLPPSSVSRAVARLEEQLGVRLLERTTRALALSEEGRAFFERARCALEDLDAVTAAVSDRGRTAAGSVRVTMPPDVGTLLLADAIGRLVERHPSIRLEVSLSNRKEDLIADGFDLALRVGPLADSSLMSRKVATISGLAVAAPSYVERHGLPRAPTDLGAHHCVLFRRGPMTAVWDLLGPDGTIEIPVRGAIEVDDMTFAYRAAVAGAGLTMLPSFIALPAVERGELVRVLPGYRFAPVSMYLVTPSSRLPAARVVAVRDFLIEELARLPGGD